MSTIIIITPPPPPPPPPPEKRDSLTFEAQWAYLWEQAWNRAHRPVKSWWRSKLVWLGTSLSGFGFAIMSAVEWALADKATMIAAFGAYGPKVFIGVGAVVVVFRYLTKGGIGK